MERNSKNEGTERFDTDKGAAEANAKFREVRYEFTPNLPQILEHLGVSLLISTYQAGKVLVLGAHQGTLKISFMHFDRAMGVAATHDRIAVGTRRQVHFLRAAPEIARESSRRIRMMVALRFAVLFTRGTSLAMI